MITTLLFDFSRVLLLPKDITYKGELNALHRDLSSQPAYSFTENFELNQPLFDLLKQLKNHQELYIFTSGNIQNALEVKVALEPLFKQVFSAMDIGHNKKDPQAYTKILTLISKNPEEVLFIDDSPENVGAARQAKLNAIQYISFEQLTKDLQKLL